ncbi:MAG: S-formylglutathione hydrolase [Pseudomonadaceae bacterium]|nr:S-formylglutathione hydrolase [Pseudomonadaceae bacterium]
MSLEIVGDVKSFAGRQIRYRHHSQLLNCDMHFSVYLPPQANQAPVPVLYWLSGLTCTDENFVQKAGAQQWAAEYGIAVIAPDTSPRGDDVPDDPEGAYDFGLGAGFYVDATQAPWSEHYRMYSYITEELPALLASIDQLDGSRQSISGHSMGGHGALIIGLRNPDRFRSISAFAPISNPINCPWGQKALAGYLGPDPASWRAFDACALLEDNATAKPIRIDQGDADDFLAEQLAPDQFIHLCKQHDVPLTYESQPGYDHSYFFIASFMREHVQFHAHYLYS